MKTFRLIVGVILGVCILMVLRYWNVDHRQFPGLFLTIAICLFILFPKVSRIWLACLILIVLAVAFDLHRLGFPG